LKRKSSAHRRSATLMQLVSQLSKRSVRQRFIQVLLQAASHGMCRK
jgi:hypothetical protein